MFDAIDEAAGVFERIASSLTERELGEPSSLRDWSRRHVIAHFALNAEGFTAAVASHRAGNSAYMYPAGAAQRDRDIDQLAGTPSADLLNRLTEVNASFVSTWSEPPGDFGCAIASGHPAFASTTVPVRRLRELQVHLIDLDIEGVGPDSWLEAFVATDLELQWPTVKHRTSGAVRVVDELDQTWHSGRSALDEPARRVDRGKLLAWVLDRGSVSGLPQLEAWANRSRWEHIGED